MREGINSSGNMVDEVLKITSAYLLTGMTHRDYCRFKSEQTWMRELLSNADVEVYSLFMSRFMNVYMNEHVNNAKI